MQDRCPVRPHGNAGEAGTDGPPSFLDELLGKSVCFLGERRSARGFASRVFPRVQFCGASWMCPRWWCSAWWEAPPSMRQSPCPPQTIRRRAPCHAPHEVAPRPTRNGKKRWDFGRGREYIARQDQFLDLAFSPCPHFLRSQKVRNELSPTVIGKATRARFALTFCPLRFQSLRVDARKDRTSGEVEDTLLVKTSSSTSHSPLARTFCAVKRCETSYHQQ